MSEKEGTAIHFGFCSLLTLLFIALKLLGKITWAWIWVISPLWIPLAVLFALALGIAVAFSFAKS